MKTRKSHLYFRIVQRRDTSWLNVTIQHASYEDNGRYYCGDDMKNLAVIDTSKFVSSFVPLSSLLIQPLVIIVRP